MARRRGFFAELQHQQAVAARNRQREQAAAERERMRLAREMERLRREQERTELARRRAHLVATEKAVKDRARRHAEMQAVKADLMNAELQVQLTELDELLAATLAVDDYVDLEGLRKTVEHPPFTSIHQAPLPAPELPQAPPEPKFAPPPAPTGLSGIFGKKKHAAEVAAAQQRFATIHHRWQQEAAQIPALQLQRINAHQAAEHKRKASLAEDEVAYLQQCAERQRQIDEENQRLDQLIEDLRAGVPAAVEEYLFIVFSNSVYPDYFPGVSDWTFDAKTGELDITFGLPRPDQLPTIRQHRYVKARDEFTSTTQTQKEQRDRYAGVVHQVALRTLHEVWESDRLGHVHTIAFTGRVGHIDPATGREQHTTLIQLAVAREQFAELQLGNVTPAETLKHLRATVSKNPHGLVGIATGPNVRAH